MRIGKTEIFIIVSLIVAFLVSAIAYEIKGLSWALGSALVVALMAISFKYPRLGLWGFLIYLPFAGTVSYIFGSIYQVLGERIAFNSDYALFHLAKDLFYLPALIGIVFFTPTWSKFRLSIGPLIWGLIALTTTCLLTLFLVNGWQAFGSSGNEKPFLMGLVGIKVMLGYIPFMLCGYYLIRDRRDLHFFNRLHLILLLVCCSLCVIQYLLLTTGVCPGNVNLPGEAASRATLQASCFVGGSLLYNPELNLLRLPGTFVAPWQWGWFLIANAFWVYGTYASDPNRFWRYLSLGGMGLLLLTALISGQRIALICVPLIFLILICITTQKAKNLGIKLAALGSLLLASTAFPLVQDRFANFLRRWNYAPPPEFVIKQFSWVNNSLTSWLGNGLGRTASTARRLGKTTLVEVFPARLLYEIGPIGLVIFFIFVSQLCWLTYQAWRSLTVPRLRKLGICFWLFILFISYNIWYYPLMVDPVAVYYWLIAGILFKLPELTPPPEKVEI